MNFTTLIDLLVIRNKTPTEVQSSMRELYLKYGKDLVGKGIEMLKVRERELARDIAIDLMLVTLDKAINRIWEYKITSEERLKYWLFAVFKNEVRMYLRVLPEDLYYTSLTENSTERDEEEEELSSTNVQLYEVADNTSDFIEAESDHENKMNRLWTLLDKLSEHEKNVVLLRVKDKLTYDQIAERLQFDNVELLRQQFKRAKDKLKKLSSVTQQQ